MRSLRRVDPLGGTVLRARTGVEELLYLQLHPCDCGDDTFDRYSRVSISRTDRTEDRYEWTCTTCQTPRVFVFEIRDSTHDRDESSFGGAEPSDIVDPGEWLLMGMSYALTTGDAALAADQRRECWIFAADCVVEALKFLPSGADAIPDRAFTSAAGGVIRHTRPDLFVPDALRRRARRYRRRRPIGDELLWGGIGRPSTARRRP